MSKTNYGNTIVNVGDEQYTLNFNLKAVKGIEARFGGLAPALQELQKVQLSAVASVIAIGTGKEFKRKDLEELEEAIFDEGVGEVTPQVIPYILAMLNPKAKKAEDEEKAAEGNA
ncbi:hypothetical protein [Pseudomonas sp.]|uniref:hypothetical protein n=1 Tax=Pseudomonas sp. TaxID=306 RepID=UPI0028A0E59A|nr:hypothetical protein [Pseudomonas sp.]